MTTYTWEYGSAASGLQFTIAYDNTTSEFTVTSLVGSFDLNALWISDGNTSGGVTLAKPDKELNMNGANTVWDDGATTTQTFVWDDYGKLSSPGLGPDGVNKNSFITTSDGEVTFALSNFVGLDLNSLDLEHLTLGVRATSVNGNGTIKWVDVAPDAQSGNNP